MCGRMSDIRRRSHQTTSLLRIEMQQKTLGSAFVARVRLVIVRGGGAEGRGDEGVERHKERKYKGAAKTWGEGNQTKGPDLGLGSRSRGFRLSSRIGIPPCSTLTLSPLSAPPLPPPRLPAIPPVVLSLTITGIPAVEYCSCGEIDKYHNVITKKK
jgi:hypothetical protein